MKNRIIIFIVYLVVHSGLCNAEVSKSGWTLINDENQIQVYIYEISTSDIVKAKTKTVIHAPVKKVKSILDDINHRHEWVPYLKKSTALTQYKNNKRIEYSHFSAPWPASDRDFVYLIELLSESSNKLVYKMRSVDSALMPINENRIRAELFESIYTLTEIDSQTTEVELIFHADPKGWLPNWIINIIQRVLPYKILLNLRKIVKNHRLIKYHESR